MMIGTSHGRERTDPRSLLRFPWCGSCGMVAKLEGKRMAENRSADTPCSDSRLTSLSLLQRARQKEPDAWQRLVILYEPLVRHWCRRGGVAAQDIADVTQEVF